jgi:hypothetical protein
MPTNVGEGTLKQKPFCPLFKKKDNLPKPSKIPSLMLNLDDFGMGNIFSYHQQIHSKKTCHK